MKKRRGQVVVEYVLLLVLVVSVALLLTNFFNRGVNPDSSGPVFQYWYQVIERIGADDG